MVPYTLSIIYALFFFTFNFSSAAARCTRTNNVSFTLTTYNASDSSLNNTVLGVRSSDFGGLPGIFPGSANSLLPIFHEDNTIWRYNSENKNKLEQGYLQKNFGGSLAGWTFTFGGTPREQDITTIDIGCDYYGRHFLMFGGISRWNLCDIGGGAYSLGWAVTNNPSCKKDVKWIWIDYVRPVDIKRRNERRRV